MADEKDDETTFVWCDDCEREHNSKGESRMEYEARKSGAPLSRTQQLQQVLDEVKARIAREPANDATFNVGYVMEAATVSPVPDVVKATQMGITQYTAGIEGFRIGDGRTLKPQLGDVLAGLVRTAVDALMSSNDGLEKKDSIKALFNALVDEAFDFYSEKRDLIDEEIAKMQVRNKELLAQIELAVAMAIAADKRQEEEDIKSGKAEREATLAATALANAKVSEEQKQKEMEALLKTFQGKNLKVH